MEMPPIYNIPCSVPLPLEMGPNNYYSIIKGG